MKLGTDLCSMKHYLPKANVIELYFITSGDKAILVTLSALIIRILIILNEKSDIDLDQEINSIRMSVTFRIFLSFNFNEKQQLTKCSMNEFAYSTLSTFLS